jgi:hypothetical protein
MKSLMKFADLESYCAAHDHLKEKWIAEQAGIDPARFSKLKTRKYGLRPTPEETAAIAKLLNQSEAYVTRQYERAA